MDAPVCIPATKNTVQDFCNRIHRSIMEDFHYALVFFI